jgi:GNAT superfamily N-acetyltransferase
VAEYPIWQLTDADGDEAGALLARAFVDEPIFVAACPDRSQRARLCPSLFATNIWHACRFGQAWAAGVKPEAMQGVLYWTDMPEGDIGPERAKEFGYDAIFADWGGALEKVVALEEAGIAAITDLPASWRYLQMIGVEPAWQGRGLGTALLRHAVVEAEAAGTALALVTERVDNVPLYQRVGLLLAGQGVAKDTTVPWWAFRTPPFKYGHEVLQ